MTRYRPLASKALQSALRESLELHIDGIVDPAARWTAVQAACGRIAHHLDTAALPDPADELDAHQALIAAALRAAAQQLCGEIANA